MPGRTAREAVEAYVKPIQQSLSCVTQSVLKPSGYGESDKDDILTFPVGAVPIGGDGLHFRFVQRFRTIVIPDQPHLKKVSTTYYSYAVEGDGAEEIIGYHWHPMSTSRINYPHLHLGNGAKVGRPELENAKAHLPTGRVGIEEIVHLLIETFKVPTQRVDHAKILRTNLNKFFSFATWGKRST